MYDYKENLKNDIRKYIEDCGDWNPAELDQKTLLETLSKELWEADYITDNPKEDLEGNIDIIREMCIKFDLSAETIAENFLNENYDFFDLNVRIYLLEDCISEVLEELKNGR